MAIGIEQHHGLGSRQGADDAQVGDVTGGEDNGGWPLEERRQLLLQRHVPAVTAVGHARTGGASALLDQGSLGGGNGLRVKRQAQVVVGTGQNDATIADAPLGGGMDLIDAGAKRVEAAVLERFALLCQAGETVIQPHDAPPGRSSVRR